MDAYKDTSFQLKRRKMYSKRVKIFVIVIAFLLLVCLLRLIQMQLLSNSYYRDRISQLKLQQGRSQQLKTVRGEILDREGRVLAADEPDFKLHIDYGLSRFFDERVRRSELLKATGREGQDAALSERRQELEGKLDLLEEVIGKCTYFGLDRSEVEEKINGINDRIWDLRVFQTWRQKCSKSELLEEYKDNLLGVKPSDFIADFEKQIPDANARLILVAQSDIAEMYWAWPLLELKTDDDIFTAQLEFMDIDSVRILPRARRFYPYGSVAAQTIGWVGPAQEADKELFTGDKLSSYLSDEVCGREDGVEYVCEAVLRGRRGEVIYDIDRKLVGRTETQFGKDVTLTLDVELQQRIEQYLADCTYNPNCEAPMAAVVIEVQTGDILALVSVPVFDLNKVRQNYNSIRDDANRPLLNRAINKRYPPGSAIKPLILIAGLEAGKITPDEVIPCPAKKAPKGWPSCWLYNRYPWTSHDDKWSNYARNAIKGSCNIYFSRLANRIEPSVLQEWLFKFGYGREILEPSAAIDQESPHRNFRQVSGQISSVASNDSAPTFEQLGVLSLSERRLFGMGQGNFRVTVLQVANAMAAIARGGFYRAPRLFIEDANNGGFETIDLGVSAETLDVVREGMSAVVNEEGGTAYSEFAPAGFISMGIEVFGKTGSTEKPDHAWFAGFAEDGLGRGIAIAVLVEGGQHGSSDAGPLARDIIQFCIEAGCMGQSGPGAD